MRRNKIKRKSMVNLKIVTITLVEALASPDVRLGRLSYRIIKVVDTVDEFILIRGDLDEEPYHMALPTFNDALDALERDSVDNSVWYGEPEWLRKPDFKAGVMVDI